MSLKLANELLEAAKGLGNSIKKKEETHKMAEANKALHNLDKYNIKNNYISPKVDNLF